MRVNGLHLPPEVKQPATVRLPSGLTSAEVPRGLNIGPRSAERLKRALGGGDSRNSVFGMVDPMPKPAYCPAPKGAEPSDETAKLMARYWHWASGSTSPQSRGGRERETMTGSCRKATSQQVSRIAYIHSTASQGISIMQSSRPPPAC
jgi:hypothetical protein